MNKVIRDPIYKYIEIDPLTRTIIDTFEFQRLRQLKQLGVTYLVFPSATHTRFQHSLQVYDLSRRWMIHFQKNQPELNITDRLVLLVSLGGLLHDIGHSILSHLCDTAIEKVYNTPSHEIRSQTLIRYMVKKYDIDLTIEETEFICSLITGDYMEGYDKYLYEITACKETQFDVDKIAYLELDSYSIGSEIDLQFERIKKYSKVINDHIVFHKKVYWLILDVFQKRYRMFREVYKHPAVLGAEKLVTEILHKMDEFYNWKNCFETLKWVYLTDSIIDQIPFVYMHNNFTKEEKEKYQVIFDLYIDLCERKWEKVSITLGNTKSLVNIGLSSAEYHPMNILWFFNNEGDVYHIPLDCVSSLISPNYKDNLDVEFKCRIKDKNI